MRATLPIVIDTTAKLTSSTVAEVHDPAAYSAVTAYTFGDLRKVVADYSIYEYLQPYDVAVVGQTPGVSPRFWRKIGPTETAYDGAKINYALGETCSFDHRCYESLILQTAVNPLPVYPETQTAFWYYVQPTNKWAMLDGEINTQTVCPSPLTVTVAIGQRINTAGLTRMVGNTLLLKATSVGAGGTTYPLAYDAAHVYVKGECMTVGMTTCYQSKVDDNTYAAPNATYWDVVSGAIFDLNVREVFDATSYYYAPFSTRPTKTVFAIPLVSDTIITMTLTATEGNVKCGALILGTNVYLGKLLKPARNEGKSFSTVTRDLYSKATLVKRPMIRKLTGTLLVPSYMIDAVLTMREETDAVPTLYSGLEEDGDWTDATSVYGVHQDFTLGTTEGLEAEISFSAEEI